MRKFLKKVIPATLFGRLLLIVIIPIITVQLMSIYIFYYNHIDRISKYMARSVVNEIIFIKNSIDSDQNKEVIQNTAKYLKFQFFYKKDKILQTNTKKDQNLFLKIFDLLPIIDPLNRLKIELKKHNLVPFNIYLHDKLLVIEVVAKNGTLEFIIEKNRITNSSRYIFTLWNLVTSIITTIIAIFFLRSQIKSIKKLGAVAERFGNNQEIKKFKPSGTKEIKLLAISLLKMQRRIKRQINQKTKMLSHISHDLRTPLTRMKLQLEMMQDLEGVNELKSDIKDMEYMINEYLDFSKENKGEKNDSINIKPLLQEIASYYKKMNKSLIGRFNLPVNLNIIVQKNNFVRAIKNLINNAFNHGSKVLFSSSLNRESEIIITVEDNGLGIPKEEMKNIFKPFYRVDNARNLDKSGVGLGLSIASDVIYIHGGQIEASKSHLGGLKMQITLPITTSDK